MRRLISVLALTAAFALPGLHATSISYAVTVDTGSLVSGYLDFQLSAGGAPLDLSVTISDSNIPAGVADPLGTVAGAFPGSVTLSTAPGGFSALLQQVTSFPSTLAFLLTFTGSYVDNPDLIFGTKFSLAILEDDMATPALPPIDGDGFILTIDIGPGTLLSAVGTDAVSVSQVPEPRTALMVGFAMLALMFWRVRRA